MTTNDWELVESGTYSSTYKNLKTDEYIYMDEQADGKVIVKFNQNKKRFKGWLEALKFKKRYIKTH